jgi:hypothetical protein
MEWFTFPVALTAVAATSALALVVWWLSMWRALVSTLSHSVQLPLWQSLSSGINHHIYFLDYYYYYWNLNKQTNKTKIRGLSPRANCSCSSVCGSSLANSGHGHRVCFAFTKYNSVSWLDYQFHYVWVKCIWKVMRQFFYFLDFWLITFYLHLYVIRTDDKLNFHLFGFKFSEVSSCLTWLTMWPLVLHWCAPFQSWVSAINSP